MFVHVQTIFFLVFNTTCLTKIRKTDPLTGKRYIPMSHCHGCRQNGTLFRSRSNDFNFNTLDLFFDLLKLILIYSTM